MIGENSRWLVDEDSNEVCGPYAENFYCDRLRQRNEELTALGNLYSHQYDCGCTKSPIYRAISYHHRKYY